MPVKITSMAEVKYPDLPLVHNGSYDQPDISLANNHNVHPLDNTIIIQLLLCTFEQNIVFTVIVITSVTTDHLR